MSRAKTHVPKHATDELRYPRFGKREREHYQCEHCLMIYNSEHQRDEHLKTCPEKYKQELEAADHTLESAKMLIRTLQGDVEMWKKQATFCVYCESQCDPLIEFKALQDELVGERKRADRAQEQIKVLNTQKQFWKEAAENKKGGKP